jgi:hypothetical protein
MMDIKFIKGKKNVFCRMVDGDECIGTKCKFAVCSYRPPQLKMETGECNLKLKDLNKASKFPKKSVPKIPVNNYDDDPTVYKKYLNKRMKKNFKIKDFYG